jgi:hypothetical protein
LHRCDSLAARSQGAGLCTIGRDEQTCDSAGQRFVRYVRPSPVGVQTVNWEMLGAIGEILGAFGVIATLGYLAVQLRANTRALRLEAEREAFDGIRLILAQLSGDAELARIIRVGLEGMDSLDADEAMRFGGWLLSNTNNWLRIHSFEREGTVQRNLADATRRIRRDIVQTRGYRQWFELRKHWIPDEFREALECEMAAASEGGYVSARAESE